MSGPEVRPITILIAALGGEGGGVLTDWIVAAAARRGLPGAVDVDPRRRAAHRRHHLLHRDRARCPAPSSAEGRPVLALAPGVGDVDVVMASELLEAGRAVAAGFVTPDRTLMIASTSRAYLVVEKIAMGDGRYDSSRLIKAVEQHSQAHLLVDMEALAKQSGAMINAVMLGAHRRLRPPADSARRVRGGDPRRRQGGRSNLRGFRAGLEAAQRTNVARAPGSSDQRDQTASSALAELERAIARPCRRPRAT